MSADPQISILISIENQPAAALACLRAIAARPPARPFEIILAQPASGAPPAPDRLTTLATAAGVRVLAGGRNAAAAAARGNLIQILDRHAAPRPGAIDALADLLDQRPDAGMAGSKLIGPDGTLRHAGFIVWADGTASDAGKGEPPGLPAFNYVREVDYVSAASLLVRRDLWARLGFDEPLGPGFAFRMRAMGQKTLYAPRSVVDLSAAWHPPEITDPAALTARWAETLAREHYPPGQHGSRARDRARLRPVLLAIDHRALEPDRDAGSRSVMGILQCLTEAGWVVKFWPNNQAFHEIYTSAMEAAGIEVIDQRRAEEFSSWIAREGRGLDHVLVVRPEEATYVIGALLRHTGADLSYYGLDLHFARMRRQAILADDANLAWRAGEMELLERRVWRAFDTIIYPSAEEAQTVRSMSPGLNVHHIVPFRFETAPLRTAPPALGPAGETILLFVAGFAHNPNVDAARFLVAEILPLVEQGFGPVHLVLAGSGPTPEVLALAGPRVTVTGFITDDELARLYLTARASVVPLRFGAGVKGKVIEAMSHGLPVVTTSIGAQGIAGLHGIVPVRDEPAEIAAALASLLRDDAAWLAQSRAQSDFAQTHYSPAAMRRSVLAVFQSAGGPKQGGNAALISVDHGEGSLR